MIVGFVVNPIAGMGGSVGLKGTDGEAVLELARAKGALKSAPRRAVEAMRRVRERRLDLALVTCAGEMGKDELDDAGLACKVVYEPRQRTSRTDTLEGVKAAVREGANIIVFVGGDGTARDVLEVVGLGTPVIGIPAGVKMHSAVFVNGPDELADVLQGFLEHRRTKDADVMDVDESAFREGIASAKLFGIAKVPDDSARMQSGKVSYHSGTADDEAAEVGQYIADSMKDDVLYIVGPGSTTSTIAKAIGCDKTLLGVDVYLDKRLIEKDADEATLLRLLSEGRKAEVIVTPIGAQGFFLGRGNQQISPRVLEAAGTDSLTVVATPTKLAGTPVLRVDTGDAALDERLRGKRKIVTGYGRRKLVSVA